MEAPKLFVDSEIADLECLLVHRPDKGIGRITPEKLEDWLYDDTVYLSRMQDEYDVYLKLLLWFLDPENAKRAIGKDTSDLFRPDSAHYIASPFVRDVQKELADVLKENPAARDRLVAVVCALENVSSRMEDLLQALGARDLARVLITGFLPDHPGDIQTDDGRYIFPPIPNLVFTRDIGIMMHDQLLLSKTMYKARQRESVLAKFIAFNHYYRDNKKDVMEITEPSDFFLLEEIEQKRRIISIEGGDIMMISPRHVLVGCSERTTQEAGVEIMQELFHRDIGIEQVSIIKIPPNRAQMHIDTIFTKVRKDTWALYGEFSQELWEEEIQRRQAYSMIADDPGYLGPPVKIYTFHLRKFGHDPYDTKKDYGLYTPEDYAALGLFVPLGLDGLLRQISVQDFGCELDDVKILYSGNNEFPYDEREQWTDACNYLAIREGVVIGYDRNEKTAVAFRNAGFEVIKALDLIAEFEEGKRKPEEVQNTLIELPSSELSRARGGSHCMSMPLRRKGWKRS